MEYVAVGGEAVIYQGYVRLTGDVDLLYGTEADHRLGVVFRGLGREP